MSKHLLILALAAMVLFGNCGSEDDEPTNNEGTPTISLDDLSRGQGSIAVSGNESFNYDGIVVGANLRGTINDKTYNILRITVPSDEAGDNRSLSLTFYIPTALDQTVPPNGNITITSDDASLDETYASCFVIGENDTYNSLSTSVGTVTVSNSSTASNSFGAFFEVENLNSFDDNELDARGAFKF
ncbi:MAG: hypothetical protein AAFO69_13980 [Bacteroidota bacterium]